MSLPDVVIVAAARTPVGSFLGGLAPLSAPELGAAAIKATLGRTSVEPAAVEHVYMGNVLQAGVGQAPARQAAILSGLPKSTGAVTVHKVCGSGLRAVMDAANALRVGEWRAAIAGGMESMSNAPYLLERARTGLKMGDVKLTDSIIKDGLRDPYSERHMGECAELCVQRYAFTRAEQDAFALESYKRAQAATERGAFAAEIVPVVVPGKRGNVEVARDEEPFAAPLEKMATLKPAFVRTGSITAANSSKINDGAAALLLMTAQRARELELTPLARLVAQASAAQEPEWFTTAPAFAVREALRRAGLEASAVGRWEINEAFAAVAMAAIRDLELDPAVVNVRGGAVALGHPIGASGARILTTLLHTLQAERQRYGVAAICIGGGESVAVVLESLA